MTNITIRSALPSDHRASEDLTRDAFWDLYQPGSVEHLILHNARRSPDFVPEFDLVALDDEEIVGCILATRARVVADDASSRDVVLLGPLAVRPNRQRSGIGGLLIRSLLERARPVGFGGAFLFGSPDYYPRFGFEDARRWGVTTADGTNFPAFMGIELYPGGLTGTRGRLVASSAFEVDPSELEVFERGFPSREKHVTATQFAQ